jgi:predicted ATP-dependent endonuclease of OLD family
LRWSKLFRQHIREAGYEHAQTQFRHETGPLAIINRELKANLGYHLDVQFSSGDDIPIFLFKGSEKIDFQQLSMGERSIIHLLFCIYGYDIRNAMLLIDEPELHLHINMQKAYFEILKNATKAEKIQIIVATHSSVFIDEKTIGNTHRFTKINGFTKIYSPHAIDQSEKDLVQILTYTNSSRIFFSNNVLIVEGDSDEYFFRYFYERYIKPNKTETKSLEIIHIGGKNNFKRWKDFLKLFGINCFFICDLDNINEFKILQNLSVDLKGLQGKHKESLLKKIDEKRLKQRSKDGVALLKNLDTIISNEFQIDEDGKKNLEELWLYLMDNQSYNTSTLIEFLKENKKDVATEISVAIEKLYDEQQVFILKEGALEDYIGSGPSKLDNVISFCEKEFENWILTSKRTNSSKLSELENIFSKIDEYQI